MIERNTGAVLPYSKYIVRGMQKKLCQTINIEVQERTSPDNEIQREYKISSLMREILEGEREVCTTESLF